MHEEASTRLRLVVVCPDRVGILAAVTRCLADAGANVESSKQFISSPVDGTFFLRLECLLPSVGAGELRRAFKATVADRFSMRWQLRDVSERKRIAVLVSREGHCLAELLWLWRNGELAGDVTLVASEFSTLASEVATLGVPYVQVSGTGADLDEGLLEVLDGVCDLVVMARYSRSLSADFLERLGVPVINIQPSFLPTLWDTSPYEWAYEEGFKLIGATAHYVTNELSEGPIIEQEVVRVSHEDDLEGLERLGARVERSVLARAVQLHCEDRVLTHGRTAVVFT